jgi:hypothetical protein
MYAAAPRADVGGGALAGALMALFAFITAPSVDNFDFNIIFGALGVILPFAAGYMPKHWKSIYMALVGLVALIITALFELLLTGTLTEATKSLGLTMLTTVLVGYLTRPVHPEAPVTEVEAEPQHYVEGQPLRRRRNAR